MLKQFFAEPILISTDRFQENSTTIDKQQQAPIHRHKSIKYMRKGAFYEWQVVSKLGFSSLCH